MSIIRGHSCLKKVEEKFATALSEKLGEEAIKEISLKTKNVFPKRINYILIFFTPHYPPASILKGINLSLNPKIIVGIMSPLLIFEDRIIEKGIISCAINKESLEAKNIFLKEGEFQNIESSLRLSLKGLWGKERFLLSFLSHQCSPLTYLKEVRLALGNIFNFAGAGYIKRHGIKNFQIVNNIIDEGLVNIVGRGMKIRSLRMGGFLPLGKPFTINRLAGERNIIREINKKPAINIYKDYLEEKFETFRKNRLFAYYPLGIKKGKQLRLVNVTDYLDDGSLVCLGELKENIQAHLTFFSSPRFFKSLSGELKPLRGGDGLIFIMNSLLRKKILKGGAQEEIRLIKHNLGEQVKVIGMYADYSLFPDIEDKEIAMDATCLLLTCWE